MTQQATIDGLWETTASHTELTKEICEKFPAAANDPGLFFMILSKRLYPWMAQLDEQKWFDVKELLRHVQSYDRRRQQWLEEEKKRQRGA